MEYQERGQSAQAGRGQAGENGEGVNETLVQNPQHHVDHQNGHDQQHSHAAQRGLVCRGSSLKTGADGGREGFARQFLDAVDGVAKRNTGQQVERDGDRRQLAEMRDGERTGFRLQPGYRVERHQFPRVGANVEQGQAIGVALVCRQQFHDHVVGVGGHVDVGDFARAIRVVQSVLDLLCGDAESRGAVAVNIHGDLGAGNLEVAVHVGEARHGLHAFLERVGGTVQFAEVGPLQGVLVEAPADKPADAHQRRILKIRSNAGKGVQLGPQSFDNLLGRGSPHAARPQADGEAPLVAGGSTAALADARGERLDIGIGLNHGSRLLLPLDHAIERDVLGSLGRPAQLPGVLVGNEALGNQAIQIDGGRQRPGRGQHGEEAVADDPAEGPPVEVAHPVEHLFRGALEGVLPLSRGLEEPAAQHGGEAERDETGNDNGRHNDDGELMEQPAHDAAHEQHGDEDRGQRKGHGEDGEADLAASLEGGLHARLSHLHVADDVLQDHDGVVHHETHRKGQRHQRKIIEGVARQRHDSKRADDRHGQREGGDRGGGDVPQEEKDHHDHQRNRQDQGELHVVDGFANGLRPVVENIQLHRGRHLLAEAGQKLLDGVHHLDGIAAGLALHNQVNGARVVVPGRDLVVLHAVDHPPQLLQANGRAVAVSHDEGAIRGGGIELPGGLNGVGLPGSPESAGG